MTMLDTICLLWLLGFFGFLLYATVFRRPAGFGAVFPQQEQEAPPVPPGPAVPPPPPAPSSTERWRFTIEVERPR